MKPSSDVVYVCKIAEKTLRTNINFSSPKVMSKLILTATRAIEFHNVFKILSDHILDQEPLNNHIIKLVYEILNVYFNLRIHPHNNSINEVKDRIRHKFSKLIHFKHQ